MSNTKGAKLPDAAASVKKRVKKLSFTSGESLPLKSTKDNCAVEEDLFHTLINKLIVV